MGSSDEGVFESYGYADLLDEVAYEKMSEERNKLEDTHRFYPLSASYFWFQHDRQKFLADKVDLPSTR